MAKDKRSSIIAIALKLAKNGKIAPAIKEYEKIIQFKPDDLEIRRIIGDLQFNLKNLPEAVKQFDWIADFYRREGFHAKAIAMLKRVTKIDPSNEKVSYKLAELYSAQGLTIEAKQIYLDLAEDHKRKNDIKSALKMYEKILEFDSGNINMRLLLAENYLKEDLKEDAIREYLTVSDILIRKKEYSKIEELLTKVISRVKNERLMEKLASSYTKQGKTDEAIKFLQSFGSEIYKHMNLLKILGDLFFDKGLIKEAEQIYLKICSINPEEIEVIMKLGRVYMNQKEFEKTYDLFIPVVDNFVDKKKYEDAISLLRFILTANDSFAPVREKMAEIFKLSKKKNSLIQVLESLIPVYDAANNTEKLKKVLEELIGISETPYEYESKLKELGGQTTIDDNEEISADDEFMNHNFRKVEEAMQISNFAEAEKILKIMKNRFPGNLNISLKLYDLYEQINSRTLQVDEGYVILGLYKTTGMNDEYSELLEKLIELSPDNLVTQNLAANERTDINLDFGKSEVHEELGDIHTSDSVEIIEPIGSSEIFELTDEDSVIKSAEEVKSKTSTSASDSNLNVLDVNEMTKSGADTKKSLDELLKELNFHITNRFFHEAEKLITDLQASYHGNERVIEAIKKFENAKKTKNNFEINSDDSSVGFLQEDSVNGGINIDLETGITDEIHLDGPLILDDNENDSNGDSDSGILIEISDPINIEQEESEAPEIQEIQEIPEIELEVEEVVVLNDNINDEESGISEGFLSDVFNKNDSTGTDSDTKPPFSDDSPFDELDESNIFEGLDEDDLFDGDPVVFDGSNYFDLEEKAKIELEAIVFWLRELERQRTSTIEKNMVEIFQEFKKGVEEKIGQEDYDTRYNLGIAYKEMGLLEEAIHEFLISSKHPLKLFDSAGLLGICFRAKGMYSESINWFKKALGIPERKDDEYLNIKYELISCYELSDDIESAKELVKEILEIDPNLRDIQDINNKLNRG